MQDRFEPNSQAWAGEGDFRPWKMRFGRTKTV